MFIKNVLNKTKIFNIPQDFPFSLYALAEGILISVRCLQRSDGDVSEPIKYKYSQHY